MTIKDQLQLSRKQLANVSESPDREAELILTRLLQLSKEELFLNLEKDIAEDLQTQISRCIKLRQSGKPLQQILGGTYFYGRWLEITESVLIPRPDTEILVDLGLEQIHRHIASGSQRVDILEIGAGSGAISITLLAELIEKLNANEKSPPIQIVACDLSPDALEVTALNLSRILPQFKLVGSLYQYNNLSLELLQSDVFEQVIGGFDLVISNPPYIPASEQETWQSELNYEPALALVSGDDGLDVYRKIIQNLHDHLKPKGSFIGEIHPPSMPGLLHLANRHGFKLKSIPGLNQEGRFIYLSPILMDTV